MRDYGKVHTSFWTSSDMRELSEDGRALAIYLLTCPHGTIAGVFRLPDGYICDDIQWNVIRVIETLSELFAKGFATRCERTKWVWVTKHLEWNPPENPNQVKAAAKMALQVPSGCSWRIDFIRKYGSFLGIDMPAFEPLSNPSETLPESVTVAVTVAVTETVDKTPPKNRRSQIDPDFYPNDTNLFAFAKTNLNLGQEIGKFMDYHQAKGSVMADWQAAWRTWVGNAVKFSKASKPAETFKERDQANARKRWEEMTGQTHPDNLPKNIIDVINPQLLELSHDQGH